ncbi:hypothetical protein KAX17_08845 [Candidatus Bipolaricaulota bacterium]|nr:hypothetical protein [Candidatus Bipolaricaulota bacterium]
MNGIGVVSLIFALLVALFVFGVLTGKQIPLVSGDRASFITLFALGFAMSALAGARDGAAGITQPWGYMIPLMILGGSAIIVLVWTLIGVGISRISGYRTAFIIMAAIIAVKWIYVHAYNLIWFGRY